MNLFKKLKGKSAVTCLAFLSAGALIVGSFGFGATASAEEPTPVDTPVVIDQQQPAPEEAPAEEPPAPEEQSAPPADDSAQNDEGTPKDDSADPAEEPEGSEPSDSEGGSEDNSDDSDQPSDENESDDQPGPVVTPNLVDNTNEASYWNDKFPHPAVCYKHNPGESTAHGAITNGGTAVTLNTFNPAWPGDHWEALIVKGGSVDSGWGPGNAVYIHPSAGTPYFAPLNAGGQQSSVSHWIVCKGTTPETTEEASATVVVTAATCSVAATAAAGTVVNATLQSSSGTTGPSTYSFVFVANDDAEFPAGDGVSDDGTTLTLTGNLSGKDLTKCSHTSECTATSSVVITDEAQMFFDDKVNGHHALTTNAMHIWTDNSSNTAKSAGYIATDFALKDAGVPYLNFTNTSGGAEPGLNLVLYVNGAWKGTLVYEPLFAKYWINKVIPGLPAGPNPGYQLAYGTLDEIIAAYESNGVTDLRIKAVGYSLGSAALGDGLVTGFGGGCIDVTFAKPPVVLPPDVTVGLTALCTPFDSEETLGNGQGVDFAFSGVNAAVGPDEVGTSSHVEYVVLDKDSNVVFTIAADLLPNGLPFESQFHAAEDTGPYTGQVFVDGELAKQVTLDSNCGDQVVVPTKPVITDLCGTANDKLTFPVIDGVTYGDLDPKTGTVTATAGVGIVFAKPGTGDSYTLSEDGKTATWTISFTDEACPTPANVLASTGTAIGGIVLLVGGLITSGFVLLFIRRKANA